jgi:hypothetical protein
LAKVGRKYRPLHFLLSDRFTDAHDAERSPAMRHALRVLGDFVGVDEESG